jgi:arylsulfatase A-like enzyme
MKVVMVMFDSLNRHMLPSYGCDWTHAPNFRRLAERTVQFERSYVCSMPCMPARRDLHTGRPNFLHRSWGPIEPFDDSVPQMLKENGIYTHLATDHYHYFEDGGATYHSRYNSWELFRGQEVDAWKGQVGDPPVADCVNPERMRLDGLGRHNWVNRPFMREEPNQPQPQTMGAGLDFIRRNCAEDNWFLQIETFDPHEPFFTSRKYKDLFAKHYDAYRKGGGKHFDWPFYRPVQERPLEVEHLGYEYASLLAMCDAYLGDVLDTMDELSMWDDTMLIVWTDHGFLLGEHDCYAKVWLPFYEEVSHTPFFIWDPRCGKRGEKRNALVQPSIDLGPTLLDFFGMKPTADMLGKNLRDVIASDAPVREAGMFGVHGGQVNVTDGRYVYMRAPANGKNEPLFEYTLMPTKMRGFLELEELRQAEWAEPFSFQKGCRTMRLPFSGVLRARHPETRKTLLFDLKNDPHQERPISDEAVEARMIGHLTDLMKECGAPAEQYERLGV